jgi:hypothetical protein
MLTALHVKSICVIYVCDYGWMHACMSDVDFHLSADTEPASLKGLIKSLDCALSGLVLMS